MHNIRIMYVSVCFSVFIVKTPDGSEHTVKTRLLLFSVDLHVSARAMVINMKQFNGEFLDAATVRIKENPDSLALCIVIGHTWHKTQSEHTKVSSPMLEIL